MTEKEVALAALQDHRDDTNQSIVRLIKEIKAEKLPELRHGDYGRYKSTGLLWLVLYRKGRLELFGDLQGSGASSSRLTAQDIALKLGNFFDDLKAISQTLESFEMTDPNGDVFEIHVRVGSIRITEKEHNSGLARHTFIVEPKEIPAFIQKLRRMEYGLRGKK